MRQLLSLLLVGDAFLHQGLVLVVLLLDVDLDCLELLTHVGEAGDLVLRLLHALSVLLLFLLELLIDQLFNEASVARPVAAVGLIFELSSDVQHHTCKDQGEDQHGHHQPDVGCRVVHFCPELLVCLGFFEAFVVLGLPFLLLVPDALEVCGVDAPEVRGCGRGRLAAATVVTTSAFETEELAVLAG